MQIRVRGYLFAVNEPFEPGHVCSASEALALNFARADKLRQALDRHVDRAGAEPGLGGVLSSRQIAELQRKLDILAAEFTFPSARRAPLVGVLDEVIREVAEERVEELERQEGRAASGPERQQLLATLCAAEPIQLEARRRLDARAKATKELEALL